MLVKHLLDSLTLVPVIRRLDPRVILDVGSGAGLPGIPLAIALPNTRVYSVDAVGKKIAFQSQVKSELGLQNFIPEHVRIEDFRCPATPGLVVARAFSDLAALARLTGRFLNGDGVIVAMKAKVHPDEIHALPEGWKVRELVPLVVPGLDAQRCAVIIDSSHDSKPEGR